MEGPGRPTDLTDELFGKIRGWVLDGKSMKEMAELSGHPTDTFYQWSCKNYQGFSDKVEGWKRDRLLWLAERNIADILAMSTADKETLRVVADMSKFTAETLGKNVGYAKRTELGQKNGENLPTPILFGYAVQANDGPSEDSGDDEEAPGDPGGIQRGEDDSDAPAAD